jgi:tetratricopeptide (TPR) repeat protein
MKDLEYIDNYFKGELPAEESSKFENRLTGDHEFAEQVAFYLTTHQLALDQLEEQKKQRFRAIYESKKISKPKTPLKKIWQYAAAAAIIIGIVIGAEFLYTKSSVQRISENDGQNLFEQEMSVKMGTSNRLDIAKGLNNDHKYPEALEAFKNITESSSSQDTLAEAKKLAGIVCIQLKDYDRAIQYFTQIEDYPPITNRAKLYHALALIKRNQPGDHESAEQLLKQVTDQDPEIKETAQKWLNTF